jgi:hypothetical protein
MLLLIPLVWSSGEVEPTKNQTLAVQQAPRLDYRDGAVVIQPPLDAKYEMRVVEQKERLGRSPASSNTGARRIDVIVSAP